MAINNQRPKSWKRFIFFLILGVALPFGYRHLSDWLMKLFPEYAIEVDKGLGFLCFSLIAVFVVIPILKEFKS